MNVPEVKGIEQSYCAPTLDVCFLLEAMTASNNNNNYCDLDGYWQVAQPVRARKKMEYFMG